MDEIRGILQALEGTSVTEFEIQRGDQRLHIRRQAASGSEPSAAGPRPAAVGGVAAAPSTTPAPPVAPPPSGGDVIKSPIVGTFYRSPDPNSPPFVSVGDRVRVGQVLCIIEAMKLMNEIEAELAGEIVQVHPENGQPVQYGDPLFTIKPEK
jgi:acetyl-CoA carboxylase biotin carboxyl carrier protein